MLGAESGGGGLMNREILFKGKHKFSDEWVVGSLLVHPYRKVCHSIFVPEKEEQKTDGIYTVYIEYPVFPDSVGQFPGLVDKNGDKVFEGDILKYTFEDEGETSECFAEVIFYRNGWAIRENGYEPDELFAQAMEIFEIAGNVFDSPELLKKAEEKH